MSPEISATIHNNPPTPYPDQQTVVQLFEQQAVKTPHEVAFILGQLAENPPAQLTYQELNQRANQLAHYLAQRGISPDKIVGVYLERSLDMVVALLAILKTGAAYLPLDPSYPLDRLAFMLADSQAPFIITQPELPPPPHQAEVIYINTPLPSAPLTNLPSHITPDHPMYIMYTSGSTGQPKGVVGLHRGAVNRFHWMWTTYPFAPHEVCCQKTALSFVDSVWEIFGPLLQGIPTVIIPAVFVKEPFQLIQCLAQYQVTRLVLVPSLLRAMLDEVKTRHALSLPTYWISSGEALPIDLYQQFKASLPQAILLNLYGSSEVAADATWYDTSLGLVTDFVPIGRPIANMEVHILDETLQPVPIGTPGELYISGVGLAQGYLHRPDLTAERFISLSGREGRLYKSGDLAQYLPDGNLQFLGRLDHQVKIRGYRVELGEIEAVLNSQPTIDQAIVTLKAQSSGDKQLVAYIKPASQIVDNTDTQEHINLWQTLYNDLYNQSNTQDITFNIDIWNSSYTKSPIPPEEMREWVDETVIRIKALKPRHVLEIGYGTGLILARVAPDCETYIGTDFSEVAFNYTHQLCQQVPGLTHVRLLTRLADDLSDFEAKQFDTIIINSVVQYFPDRLYLEKVITRALPLLKPSGYLFIGDVRHFGLLETFHTSVQIYHAENDLVIQELKQRIWQYQNQEKELLVAPEFFLSLAESYPQISHVQIQPKYGLAENELTRFRYEIILRVGQPVDLQTDITWYNWSEIKSQPLKALLNSNTPQAIGLRYIPNPRFHAEQFTQQWLAKAKLSTTVAEYRQELAKQPLMGVHVNYLRELVTTQGWHIEVSWLNTEGLGNYDVVFTPPHLPYKPAHFMTRQVDPNRSKYVNTPVQKISTTKLMNDLRAYLKSQLPDYMVPSAFVVLEQFPLTPSGKINRLALPNPDNPENLQNHGHVPPQTPTEHLVAAIWGEVFGLTQISRHDNFFNLGGHSLLATQVSSRLRKTFGVEIMVQHLFEQPTVAELSHLLDTTPRGELSLPPMTVAARSEKLPLSFAQQRLWFLDQMAGPSPTYNLPLALRLTGQLQLTILETALNEIIQRHETLRTTFPTSDGVAYQQIAPSLTLTLPIIEVSQQEYKQYLTQEARQPFDLAKGPLFRATLYRLSETDHVLLLNMHHIISDGWSIGILIEELLTHYHGQPLPTLAYQYADFAMWQRNWLQGEVLARQLSYWQEQLAGAPTLLDLPTDHPRPPVQTFNGGLIPFEINAELTTALQQFSRQHDVTLFMALYAAFAVLLTRYSGQEDVIIGSPIANRHYQEVEPLIGFFVNTLPLRVDLSGQPTFAELLRRVRQLTLAAYSHQDLPFEQLVGELNVPRNLSHTPLFQVMFALDNTPALPQNTAELQLEWVDIDSQIAKFDVTLAVSHHGQQLAATLEYNRDLFEPATITRMAGHLQTLLATIITNPNQPIATLPMLTAAEIEQFQAWNDTTVDYPQNLTIIDLFEQQVARTPNNIAVIFEQEQLTYQELNRRANQLAHYLQSLGVGPEVLVGICVERSLDMVIGLLGILKAGGAYVPLDPDYPTERLAFMLHDAHVPVLLSQSHLQERLPHTTAHLVWLDTDWQQINACPLENPEIPQNHGHHLAYVIYTSGSTGQPKGALNTHAAIYNRLLWMQSAYTLTTNDTILQKTPFSFDVSVWEFFWPLMFGARLVVARPGGHQEPQYLVDLIKQQHITTLHFVPSMLQPFLDSPNVTNCHTLKRVICSGEALPLSLMNHFFTQLSAELHNLYGPTEAAIDVSYWPCQPNTSLHAVPIGRPVANTQLYILDNYLQPLPIGIPGELHIGGIQVGRGYLNRPELTTEKFIPNPFGEGRLYKTGDLARYLPDGNIEFLGRIDHQIKLRGFRIELGEIETLLRHHESIKEAIVTLYETNGNKRLVAYLILSLSQEVELNITLPHNANLLRTYLKTKLPDYMIPSAFMVLEQFPLTPNGKIDRQALPNPKNPENPQIPGHNFDPPQTQTEQLVANIWAEVLGLTQINRHDNFFDLGGHSLLAMQIISKLNFQLQLELSVKAIFMAPTVETMAELISQTEVSPKHNLPKPEAPLIPLPNSLTTEARPLLSLLISQRIAPVEAVALSYLEHANPARGEIIAGWGAGLPLFTEINETTLGRVAIITLPYFDNELYNKGDNLKQLMVESLHLAKSVGAKVVSLTGLIPSASHYGQSLITALNPTENFPTVSTGHATTTAAVILAIEHILQISQRNVAQERVAFLGLGSIGTASLELFLQTQPHPQKLILCDLYSKKTALEELKQQVLTKFNFQGTIKIIQSSGQVPPEFYEATLIVGATNVSEILEVNDLHPGTIIIDDSAPHCFNVAAAIQRVETKKDILFSEGGMLKSPQPIHSTLYLPIVNDTVLQDFLTTYDSRYITGCVFSALLSAQLPAQTTIGLVDLAASFQHYELLKKLNFQAADIHCLHYKLPEPLIAHFSQHFGISWSPKP